MSPPPPRSTLFPYTTLFRSIQVKGGDNDGSWEPRGAFAENWGRVGQTALSIDRKSTRLNSSHQIISYAVLCLKKKQWHNVHTQLHSNTTLVHRTSGHEKRLT